MNIYITQSLKEDWDLYLTKGKNKLEQLKEAGLLTHDYYRSQGILTIMEDLLSISIVLPVEESWVHLSRKTNGSDYAVPSCVSESYPNGVIIKQQYGENN